MNERILNAEQAENVVIVGGSTYPKHAEVAARSIGAGVGDIVLKQFPNGEKFTQYHESLRDKEVFIIQTDVIGSTQKLDGIEDGSHWSVDDSVMQTVIMTDAAHRASAAGVTVIKPHFAYARQDRKAKGREPISAIAHMDILAAVGMKRLVTIDVHSPQILGHHPLSDDLSANESLQAATAQYFEEESIDSENVIFIAPDGGSLSLPMYFAEHLGGATDVMAKRRGADGKVKHRDRVDGVGGRTCVLVDDMIDTGGTLRSAAEILRRSGARKILVTATHGLFSGPALERLESAEIDKFIVSNTVPQQNNKNALGDRLEVVEVGPLIGKAIFEIATQGSVSSIFEDGKQYRR